MMTSEKTCTDAESSKAAVAQQQLVRPHQVVLSPHGNFYCKECDYFQITHKVVNQMCSNDTRKRREGYSYCEKHQQEFKHYCCGCSLGSV